jgi:bifunctional non-homologous end joining protein LigD
MTRDSAPPTVVPPARRSQPSAPLPPYAPQLATLVKAAPQGDVWLHELKYDGYRIGARLDAGAVTLISRNGKEWTSQFPTVRDAVARLKARRALLDGEVAAVLPDGRTSFQALQNAFASTTAHLVYFVFDLLHVDGDDLRPLRLEERKLRLKRLLGRAGGVLRFSDHVIGRGDDVLDAACKQGGEGIVSKRRDLPYQPGRGPGWLKTKCIQRQEFVIGGFTDPEGSRAGIGALLVGVYDGGQLTFAGKVGTGFSQKTARDLRQRLEALEQPQPPFTAGPRGWLERNAHWVRPELVAEAEFVEWTDDGKIRHSSFQGLRTDKAPTEVVRERPANGTREAGLSCGTREAGLVKRKSRRARHESRVPHRTSRGSSATQKKSKPSPHESRFTSPATKSRFTSPATESRFPSPENAVIAGVKISHPDRILYPDIGLTKLDLAKFYEGIADWILPHIAGRPLTLVRCPEGVGTTCFFMKHSKVWSPPGLRRVAIREKKKVGDYLVADSVTALIALVQMGVLEIHTWNSRVDRVEQPDRLVFDLDPGPQVGWPAVIDAARLVRAALHELSLGSFVKTTGGRGLHVVVPLIPDAEWSECLAFSRALAEAIVRLDPRRYTTAFAKAGRERQILIDYLRNNRTNTSIAAYSTRARPRAPVSVPLSWDELSPRLRSDQYTVTNLGKRLRKLRSDPWQAYWSTPQRIGADALRRLESVH